MSDFSKSIIKWYSKNHRKLPWRDTRNPYLIWLSEIILQQTRVDQGLSYYLKFVENFPTVSSLANANEQTILKMWQGLGYYSRARNLHATAKIIDQKFNGSFPIEYLEIRNLKGIGDYTAAAISSFAFNLPHAVVDGNVHRVLSRVFNIREAVNTSKGKKIFQETAIELLDKSNPGIHNQAIMELGAIVCTPVNPQCDTCPLNSTCLAYEMKITKELPVKKKKLQVKQRFFEYIVHQNNNSILLKMREEKDIWQNMYDFPCLEYKSSHDPMIVCESDEWKKYFKGKKIIIDEVSTSVKHILSHQVINARFWKIRYKGELKIQNSMYVKHSELADYPVPRLIDRYISENI